MGSENLRTVGDFVKVEGIVDNQKNNNLSDSEISFFQYFHKEISSEPDTVKEEIMTILLEGGQIHIPGKNLYDTLSSQDGKYSRDKLSSHQSNSKQFSIRGEFIVECLIGTRSHNNQEYTWLQLERHKAYGEGFFDTVINGLAHLYDWIIYKITGRNIGPYGTSNYVEHKPFRVVKSENLKTSRTISLFQQPQKDQKNTDITSKL
jgi:hypothetical protein